MIVDGIFSLYCEKLCSFYDLKVFVDVPSEVRLTRRMERNIERYGRTAEFEIEQYYEKVKPMHDKYVEPCKTKADFIFSFEEKTERSIVSFLAALETAISTK